jgi:hypothetical protein
VVAIVLRTEISCHVPRHVWSLALLLQFQFLLNNPAEVVWS